MPTPDFAALNPDYELETGMASLKEEIAAKLAAVAAPDGRPLTATRRCPTSSPRSKAFLSTTC